MFVCSIHSVKRYKCDVYVFQIETLLCFYCYIFNLYLHWKKNTNWLVLTECSYLDNSISKMGLKDIMVILTVQMLKYRIVYVF